jgi:hypothetical protein
LTEEESKRMCVIFGPLEVILTIPGGPVLKWSRSDFQEILRRLQIGMEQQGGFFVPLPAPGNGLIDRQWTLLNQNQYGPKRESEGRE